MAITAPSPWLPEGTEVVDTPGTGSVYEDNTTESSRARSTVDVAVLVVAADPPVCSAEVELVSEAMDTASAALVVVNKIDLVRQDDVPDILAFTRQAVRAALGHEVAVLATSLREKGVAEIANWLSERVVRDGSLDATGSTARAMHREATAVLDGLRVQRELLRETDRTREATTARLEEILRHAQASATAATDRLRGEAVRARSRLDESHDREVADALAAARVQTGNALTGPGPPEQQSGMLREHLTALATSRCT